MLRLANHLTAKAVILFTGDQLYLKDLSVPKGLSILPSQQRSDFAKAQVWTVALGSFLDELMCTSLCLFVCGAY